MRYVIGEEIFDEKFKVQLPQFYQTSEKVEPNVARIHFRKPVAKLPFSIAIFEKVKVFTTNKSVFSITNSSPVLAALENDTKKFLFNILEMYSVGKLSQAKFSERLKGFYLSIDTVFDKLDSEDREDLESFLSEFSSQLTLNNDMHG